jgi:hypothetical protein
MYCAWERSDGRCRCEDNITVSLRGIACEGVCIFLVQDGIQWWALVNMVINIQVS